MIFEFKKKIFFQKYETDKKFSVIKELDFVLHVLITIWVEILLIFILN